MISRSIQRIGLVLFILVALCLYSLHLHPVKKDIEYNAILFATPGNASYPLHYLDYPSTLTGIALDLGSVFPTHLVAGDIIYATNEVQTGQVLALKLGERAEVLHVGSSGGDSPAHAVVTRDGRVLVSNYASPTVSMLSKQLELLHTLTFDAIPSHPHQVILHPTRDDTFLVTDLGQDRIYTIRIRGNSLELEQTWQSHEGSGARHAVFSKDGNVLYLAQQTSCTILAIRFDDSLGEPFAFHSTLPRGEPFRSHAVSDILLEGNQLFVLNRRVDPPYTGSDTMAVFDLGNGVSDASQVSLDCWQPREILRVGHDRLAVTCVGNGNEGAGIRILKRVDGTWSVVHAVTTGTGAFGLVGVA